MNLSRMAAIVLVVLLLLAYPLSIGPVYRMHINAATPLSKAEQVFYIPLGVATELKPISRLMELYVKLWLPEGAHFSDK